MKQHYALSLFAGLLATTAVAQPPCLTSFAAPVGQTAVANAAFNAPTVPPTMTGQVRTTSTATPKQVTVSSASGLAIGSSVTGPNIPPGPTITNMVGREPHPSKNVNRAPLTTTA